MHMAGMNKWMREQAKWFLIIICVVIMVTWLVPWNNLLSKSSGAQGKIFGKAAPARATPGFRHWRIVRPDDYAFNPK